MGYRLEISEIKNGVANYKACGGKLYGYTMTELSSYEWLVEHKFLEGDEYFCYGFNPKIILSAGEFKEFIQLYNNDLNKSLNKDSGLINDIEIQKLISSKDHKLLEWY